MNNSLFTLGLCIGSTLTGCACSLTEEAAIPVSVEPSSRAAIVGLALYEPQSDVANLTSAVRHVLIPDEQFAAIAISHEATRRNPSVISDSVLASSHTAQEKEHLPRKHDQLDSVFEAWWTYCDNAQALSPKDWAIIDATNIPPELEAIWSEECTPLK